MTSSFYRGWVKLSAKIGDAYLGRKRVNVGKGRVKMSGKTDDIIYGWPYRAVKKIANPSGTPGSKTRTTPSSSNGG